MKHHTTATRTGRIAVIQVSELLPERSNPIVMKDLTYTVLIEIPMAEIETARVNQGSSISRQNKALPGPRALGIPFDSISRYIEVLRYLFLASQIGDDCQVSDVLIPVLD